MKTSSISLRVADFLKNYPPFSFLEEEDLFELAGSGKVRFHESGELVFEEGQPRHPYFYVVHKGTVNLFRSATLGAEELLDIRVEGNLLGMSWGRGSDFYLASARTLSDTIVYALPIERFAAMAEKEPKVKAFLRSYYSPQPGWAGEGDGVGLVEGPSDWLARIEPARDRANRSLLTCGPTDPVCQVARQMAPGNQEAVVVVNAQGHPLGIITESDLSGKVATDRISVNAPAVKLMSEPVVTIRPGLSTGELLLAMLRHRVHHLCVTEDGTVRSPALGVVAERDLELMHGRLPTLLTNEIRVASGAENLAAARQRAEELLLQYLETDVPLAWIASFITEIDNAITEKAISLARRRLAAEGREGPGVPFCWLAFHSEGRGERLLRSAQCNGLVFADPEVGNGEAAGAYFSAMGREVRNILEACGLPADARNLRADNPRWCRPLSGWKAHYDAWIAHPMESEILKQTPFFDLRPVSGDFSLAEALRGHLGEALERHPNFVPLLANDAMANLPPITIFRDSVMDKSGILWTSIDTKAHSLYPLVDMARVLALEAGMVDCPGTVIRLRGLTERFPDKAALFSSAVDCLHFTLRLQTQFALRRGDEGQFIRPGDLGLIEKEHVKTVFRTVAQLMDFCAKHFRLSD